MTPFPSAFAERPAVRAVARLRRLRKAAARRTDKAATGIAGRCTTWARNLPLPQRARVLASKTLLRRPWQVTVPLDRFLLGAQDGWDAREFAERTGQLLWPSTPLLDGPHAQLLRLADRAGPGSFPSDTEILAGSYGDLARRCIDQDGSYFGATDDRGIVDAARGYIDRYRGGELEGGLPGQSGPRDPVLVAPVRGSDYYQILDGHHRLASAAARGESHAKVTAKWLPVSTPLQALLARMTWLEGKRELYQPLDAPELRRSWLPVRRCHDRLAMMIDLLERRGPRPPASYLDIASCYGWFVAEMRDRGFDASGMERDPLAAPLGEAAYGLDRGAVQVGDCVQLLAAAGRTWDVISCFSLLHHFVLGRGSVNAEELLASIDQVTGSVLFLDTGQEHEEWFRRSLPGWDADGVASFLRRHTSFDEIVDLGPDRDARPPYAENYGRHLFACLRHETAPPALRHEEPVTAGVA